MKKYIVILAVLCLWGAALKAEGVRYPEKETQKITTNDNSLPPYGATLFNKNFPKEQTEGIQPEYIITHGDRISIQTWGALELSNVFMVDGQGNIFIPEIGPVSVKGVRNRDLNQSIQNHIKKLLGTFGMTLLQNNLQDLIERRNYVGVLFSLYFDGIYQI